VNSPTASGAAHRITTETNGRLFAGDECETHNWRGIQREIGNGVRNRKEISGRAGSAIGIRANAKWEQARTVDDNGRTAMDEYYFTNRGQA
jgi:hypothetical protein